MTCPGDLLRETHFFLIFFITPRKNAIPLFFLVLLRRKKEKGPIFLGQSNSGVSISHQEEWRRIFANRTVFPFCVTQRGVGGLLFFGNADQWSMNFNLLVKGVFGNRFDRNFETQSNYVFIYMYNGPEIGIQLLMTFWSRQKLSSEYWKIFCVIEIA